MMKDEVTTEIKGLVDADGQVKWHLELTETFLLFHYLCQNYPCLPP